MWRDTKAESAEIERNSESFCVDVVWSLMLSHVLSVWSSSSELSPSLSIPHSHSGVTVASIRNESPASPFWFTKDRTASPGEGNATTTAGGGSPLEWGRCSWESCVWLPAETASACALWSLGGCDGWRVVESPELAAELALELECEPLSWCSRSEWVSLGGSKLDDGGGGRTVDWGVLSVSGGLAVALVRSSRGSLKSGSGGTIVTDLLKGQEKMEAESVNGGKVMRIKIRLNKVKPSFLSGDRSLCQGCVVYSFTTCGTWIMNYSNNYITASTAIGATYIHNAVCTEFNGK